MGKLPERSVEHVAEALKWHQSSLLFVLFSFFVLPQSFLAWLVLFMIGMLNTDKDRWFRSGFLVALVIVVALLSVLQWAFNSTNSWSER